MANSKITKHHEAENHDKISNLNEIKFHEPGWLHATLSKNEGTDRSRQWWKQSSLVLLPKMTRQMILHWWIISSIFQLRVEVYIDQLLNKLEDT